MSQKSNLTYCYYAVDQDGKFLSDEFLYRQDVISYMRGLGYFSYEYDILCVCEEWDCTGDGLLRYGSGSTQREARSNLK